MTTTTNTNTNAYRKALEEGLVKSSTEFWAGARREGRSGEDHLAFLRRSPSLGKIPVAGVECRICHRHFRLGSGYVGAICSDECALIDIRGY